jgi:cytochrome c556
VASADARLEVANPVQTEMRLMTKILEGTVAAIGARDVRSIEEQLHGLHAAKQATTAAVNDGTYKLPKNPDDVAGFLAMDEAFHRDLGALVIASRANDVPAAAEALGTLVRGCQDCHARYRP